MDYQCKHQCVFDVWVDVDALSFKNMKKYEGSVPHMYLDSNGYVTVGIGDMLETSTEADSLPFYNSDGTPSTDTQIESAYAAIQKQPANRIASFYESFTTIRLEQSDIDAKAKQQIADFGTQLKSLYPNFNDLPAKVQLALYDMIFNLGKGCEPVTVTCTKPGLRGFHDMNDAIAKRDWATAAKESHRAPPVSDARNKYVHDLFEQADAAAKEAEKTLQQCPAANDKHEESVPK